MLLVSPIVFVAIALMQQNALEVNEMQSEIDSLQLEVRDLKNELSYYEFHQFPYGD